MTPDRLRAAAQVLRANAATLRDSSTVNGQWPTDELAAIHAKRDHDEWLALAAELDAFAVLVQHMQAIVYPARVKAELANDLIARGVAALLPSPAPSADVPARQEVSREYDGNGGLRIDYDDGSWTFDPDAVPAHRQPVTTSQEG